jgi:hypothetical protein
MTGLPHLAPSLGAKERVVLVSVVSDAHGSDLIAFNAAPPVR